MEEIDERKREQIDGINCIPAEDWRRYVQRLNVEGIILEEFLSTSNIRANMDLIQERLREHGYSGPEDAIFLEHNTGYHSRYAIYNPAKTTEPEVEEVLADLIRSDLQS